MPFLRYCKLRGASVGGGGGGGGVAEEGFLNEAREVADLTVHPANYERTTWLSGPIRKRFTPTPTPESRVVISALCPLAVN